MVSAGAIGSLADQIVRRFAPAKIILFGSYAAGSANEDSDVDLLVVMPHGGPSFRAASRIRWAIDSNFPLDVLVRSPNELRRRLAMRDLFLLDILEQGIVLHDGNDLRVGQQGRRRLRRRLHSAAVEKADSV
jgi:predicted nucleotidyltransferase